MSPNASRAHVASLGRCWHVDSDGSRCVANHDPANAPHWTHWNGIDNWTDRGWLSQPAKWGRRGEGGAA